MTNPAIQPQVRELSRIASGVQALAILFGIFVGFALLGALAVGVYLRAGGMPPVAGTVNRPGIVPTTQEVATASEMAGMVPADLAEALQDAVTARNMVRLQALLKNADSKDPATGRVVIGIVLSAAAQGNVDVLRTCSRTGLSMELADSEGRRPIHEAALNCDDPAVYIFLVNEARVDINAMTSEQNTALMLAAHAHHTPAMTALLALHANARLANQKGETALHIAAESGELGGLKALLHGSPPPDINAQDRGGRTPLFSAVAEQQVSAVRYLTDYGANLDAQDNQGMTAEQLARTLDAEKSSALLSAMGLKR